jgi:hypothetical protein
MPKHASSSLHKSSVPAPVPFDFKMLFSSSLYTVLNTLIFLRTQSSVVNSIFLLFSHISHFRSDTVPLLPTFRIPKKCANIVTTQFITHSVHVKVIYLVQKTNYALSVSFPTIPTEKKQPFSYVTKNRTVKWYRQFTFYMLLFKSVQLKQKV